ncbi:MAG: CDP-alcohol phosphatidyltransferase family protein, partial [Candidatus Bipolaricaulota bacterium]
VRLVLTPFVIASLAYGKVNLALALLSIALLSDLVDGFIARRMDQITDLGQILDPLADKTLFMSLFGYLSWEGEIPIIAFGLFLLPHIALIVGGGIMYQWKQGVIPSNIWGKGSSFLVSVGLIAIFFGIPYAQALIYLGVAGSYLSAGVYFYLGVKQRLEAAN